MGIGNLGITEMAVIFVIALVVFGPKRLPELGRSLGSAMREFRRSLNEIQRELEDVNPVRPVKDELNSILGPLKSGASSVAGREPAAPAAKSESPTADSAPPAHPASHPEPDRTPETLPPETLPPEPDPLVPERTGSD